ncbi:MAG: hypothetical protein NZ899_08160 [Thermoguttaceae bacterium]|nr:hypothetical protein [Thermoguttaceae bacterium]MDW8078081.1 hypothetical protein [Thermoguttaceae bacterium]
MARWKKLAIWLACGLCGIIAAAGIAFGVWAVIAWKAFDRHIERLAAAGRPGSFQELLGQVPKEGLGLAEELRSWADRLSEPALKLSELWARYGGAPDWPASEDLAALRNLTEGPAWQPVRERLVAWASDIDNLELRSGIRGVGSAVSEAPGVVFVAASHPGENAQELLTQVLSLTQAYRTLVRFGVLWTNYLAATGDKPEAVAVGLCLLRFTRIQPPFMVGLLTRVACFQTSVQSICDLMQGGGISPSTCRQIEEELSRFHPTAAWEVAIETERVFGLESFRDLGRSCGYLCRPLAYAAMNRLVLLTDAARAVPFESPLSADELRIRTLLPVRSFGLSTWGPWSVLVDLTVPAYVSGHQAIWRAIAYMRCAVVLCRITEKGVNDVTDLDMLELPANLLQDPFTNEPLQIRRRPEGWLIYSVGPDQRDDGGDFAEGKDWGIAPRKLRFR